jgi:hypothetical protein
MTFEQTESQVEVASSESKVLVGIDLNPPTQRRLSVFFRGLLVLPLLIVQILLVIPLYIVLLVSWFAAVVTGRVPDPFHHVMTNFQRFSANVNAYQLLLIPRWPGFNFSPSANEQVSIEIPNEKQRRLSIFFRGLLILPAGVLTWLWTLAHFLLTLVTWVWVLIKGRAPESLHQSGALWMRYNIRLGAFTWLLTSAQPWHGLRGDGVIPVTAFAPSELATPESQPIATDEAQPSDRTVSEEGMAPSTRPYVWFVTPRARTLINWSFPVGTVLLALYFVLVIALVSSSASQKLQVTNSYNTTYNVGGVFATTVRQCTTVNCANQAARTAVTGQRQAAAYLTGGISGASVRAFHTYRTDLEKLLSDYSAMSRSSTVLSLRSAIAKWQSDFIRTQPDAVALAKTIG